MFQTTIARAAVAEGVGLHTGVYGHVRLVPAPAETGIVFRRVDLDNFPIEAQGHNVARVSYATSLMKQGVLLSTTEHLLAAIYSCGIDNIFIDIDSIEIPILDGSAELFMQMLEQCGVRKLRRRRRYMKVLKPLEVIEGDRRIGVAGALPRLGVAAGRGDGLRRERTGRIEARRHRNLIAGYGRRAEGTRICRRRAQGHAERRYHRRRFPAHPRRLRRKAIWRDLSESRDRAARYGRAGRGRYRLPQESLLGSTPPKKT